MEGRQKDIGKQEEDRLEGKQVERAVGYSAVRHDVIRRFGKPVRAQAATVVTDPPPARYWQAASIALAGDYDVIVTQNFRRWTKRSFLLRCYGSHVGEASESAPSLSWVERSGSRCGHYRLCGYDFRYGKLLSALHYTRSHRWRTAQTGRTVAGVSSLLLASRTHP